MTDTDQEAAEILSYFFQSVFTKDPDGDVPHLKRIVRENTSLASTTVEDEQEKFEALNQTSHPVQTKFT